MRLADSTRIFSTLQQIPNIYFSTGLSTLNTRVSPSRKRIMTGVVGQKFIGKYTINQFSFGSRSAQSATAIVGVTQGNQLNLALTTKPNTQDNPTSTFPRDVSKEFFCTRNLDVRIYTIPRLPAGSQVGVVLTGYYRTVSPTKVPSRGEMKILQEKL